MDKILVQFPSHEISIAMTHSLIIKCDDQLIEFFVYNMGEISCFCDIIKSIGYEKDLQINFALIRKATFL